MSRITAIYAPLAAALLLAPPAAAQLAVQATRPDPYVQQLGAQSLPAGAAAADDLGRVVLALPDGGAVVGGTTSGALFEPNGGAGLDIVAVRLGPDGSVQWTLQIGGATAATIPALNGAPGGPGGSASGSELVNGIALAPDGSILLTGSTTSSLAETNAGWSDLFVACLEPSGALRWVRQLGFETAATLPPGPGSTAWGDASGFERAGSIVVHDNGRILVAGLTDSDLTQEGEALRPFLLELDPNGAVNWVRQLHPQQAWSFGFDIASWFSLVMEVGLLPSGEVVLGCTEEYFSGSSFVSKAVLLRYASDGTALECRRPVPGWQQSLGGLAVDPLSGRIYIAGDTYDDVGDWNAGSSTSDAFAMCLDPALTPLWTWQIGTGAAAALGLLDVSRHERVAGIRIDAQSALIVAGSTLGGLDEPNAGGHDLFTWKLRRSDGVTLGVHQLGQTTATALGISLSGNEFCGRLALGPLLTTLICGWTDGSPGEANGGGQDVFVMRLDWLGRL